MGVGGGLETHFPTPVSQRQRLGERQKHGTPKPSVLFRSWLPNISHRSPDVRSACACLAWAAGAAGQNGQTPKGLPWMPFPQKHTGGRGCGWSSSSVWRFHLLPHGEAWAQQHPPARKQRLRRGPLAFPLNRGKERALITGSEPSVA